MALFLSRWYHHFMWISFTCSFLSLTEGVPQRRMATVSSQYLTFPISGYYSNNVDAEWRISALLPSQNLKISIVSIDIQYHYNCGYDSLTIYDGYSAISPVLAKLCGQLSSLRQTFFTTSSRYVFLRFTSNNYGSGRGFKIRYFIGSNSPSPTPAVVNLYATSHSKFLTFPVSGQYANNALAQWRISALNSYRKVTIDFESLDIEHGSNNCQFDALTLYDGFDSSSTQVARLCGRVIASRQASYRSNSRYFFLRFTSDGSIRYSGFRIQYRSEDNDRFTSEESKEDDSSSNQPSSNEDDSSSNQPSSDDNTVELSVAIPLTTLCCVIIGVIVYWRMKKCCKRQKVHPQENVIGGRYPGIPTATHGSQPMIVYAVNSPMLSPPAIWALNQDRRTPSYREATQHGIRPSAKQPLPSVV